jgi:hypothetical protein
VNEGYDQVARIEAEERVPGHWAGTLACCLAHHRKMFWMPPWGLWVHSAGMKPCEAMTGEPDPEFLPCRYCGTRLHVDGAGRLWSLVPEADRHPYWEKWTEYGWLPPRDKYRWHDDAWTDKCPISPTFRHEVVSLGQKSLYVSQADRLTSTRG